LTILGGITLRLMVGRFEEGRAEVGDTPQGAPFSATEWRTVAILLFTSAFWLADFIHGLPPAIPALIAAVLLVCPRIGVIGWKDFETRLSWGLVLTVGASLSLAQALIHTGAADWLSQEFLLISTSLTQNPLLLVGVIVVTVSMVHLAITNLAACIALLIPVTMTVAKAAGLNPIVCGLIVTIVIDSVILYPVQTATNLLAYESGYYGTRDVGRFGLMMLGLTMLVGLGVALPYWSALGLPLVLR
jgi:solute carrier family 13 (sodium-dependent dicarboxylate transporter), member 2/3/5